MPDIMIGQRLWKKCLNLNKSQIKFWVTYPFKKGKSINFELVFLYLSRSLGLYLQTSVMGVDFLLQQRLCRLQLLYLNYHPLFIQLLDSLPFTLLLLTKRMISWRTQESHMLDTDTYANSLPALAPEL